VQKRFNPDEIRATEISLGRQGRQRRQGAKDIFPITKIQKDFNPIK
jgi:hypothetical protein